MTGPKLGDYCNMDRVLCVESFFTSFEKFLNSTTTKIINAGINRYLTSKLDERKNLVVQVKKKTKQVDDFQLFEQYHRNLYYTNGSLRFKGHNFSPTDISETDLRDTKLDQHFV